MGVGAFVLGVRRPGGMCHNAPMGWSLSDWEPIRRAPRPAPPKSPKQVVDIQVFERGGVWVAQAVRRRWAVSAPSRLEAIAALERRICADCRIDPSELVFVIHP